MGATLALFCLILVNTLAASISKENKGNDTSTTDNNLFGKGRAVYKADHEIVSIMVPLNALNFEDDSNHDDTVGSSHSDIILFFVEADVNNGVKDYKGLYMLKGGKATKILDQGTDAAAANDDQKSVYFAAKDGIYVYNDKENKAEKYGTVTDSLINIVKENGTAVLYVLTEDHVLYKVTEEGTKKEKVDNVHEPQQIVLDTHNNLYYYDTQKKAYIFNANGVKEIIGLSENPTNVKLIRPPFVVDDAAVPFIVDHKMHRIYANGTSDITLQDFRLQLPTAYSVEATLIQYHAYNKNIYQINFLNLPLSELLNDIKKILQDKTDYKSVLTRYFGRELNKWEYK